MALHKVRLFMRIKEDMSDLNTFDSCEEDFQNELAQNGVDEDEHQRG